MEPIIFNQLEPIEVPYKLGNTWYILLESSGAAAVKYRNAVLQAQRMQDGQMVGFEGLANAEPLLISMCLYLADMNPQGKPVLPRTKDGEPDDTKLVPLQTIGKWVNRVQKHLFETLQEISELDDKGDEASLVKQIGQLQRRLERVRADAPKNVPSSTTAGSPSLKS